MEIVSIDYLEEEKKHDFWIFSSKNASSKLRDANRDDISKWKILQSSINQWKKKHFPNSQFVKNILSLLLLWFFFILKFTYLKKILCFEIGHSIKSTHKKKNKIILMQYTFIINCMVCWICMWFAFIRDDMWFFFWSGSHSTLDQFFFVQYVEIMKMLNVPSNFYFYFDIIQ